MVFLLLLLSYLFTSYFFFFTDTSTTEIYTLFLHDALPILACAACGASNEPGEKFCGECGSPLTDAPRSASQVVTQRSEEHTSELQSRGHLVCRLLLEKKNNIHSQMKNVNDETETEGLSQPF